MTQATFDRVSMSMPRQLSWQIVLAVLAFHIFIVAIFKYGLPDFSPRKSEITIELSAALPRGEGGDGQRQVAKPVTQPMPKKAPLQDENATRKAVETPKTSATEPTAASRAAGIESAPTVDADYKAAYLNNPKPPYPPVAFKMRIEGTVTVRALVLPDGACGEVLLGRSSGSSLLDDAALETVAKWKFVPAKSQGKEISQWVSIPISFALRKR